VGGAGVLTRLLSFIGCCITGHEGDARNFEVMLQASYDCRTYEIAAGCLSY
jgi:hypothetical protein